MSWISVPRMTRSMAALAAVALAGVGVQSVSLAQSEPLLEESGRIVPAEAVYTFEGNSGDTLTLTLSSEAFDPVLVLAAPDGTELAANDDFGGSLNSTIIITLPEDGTYTVTARSFSGQGGDYDLVVRTSTPYEVTFSEGQTHLSNEDYEGAIASFTDAIALDPNQSSAYLSRAEAYLGQAYREQGIDIQGPEDIPADVREVMIKDFEKAADLIEASGNPDWAASLREQANYLRMENDTEALPDDAASEPAEAPSEETASESVEAESP